ncbi:Protein of unknown function [Pseudarcicella hirudinis]|uniref:DUF983 domain-containing protein n=1 Tax=Pseudarcicella hirudinis TaxID=1079859 RepID=A0A1I5VTB9_9BACT|nr:DUF983 domain-containing protein [Pseudarcicella hirudinis]SFQ10844.1 Protein of unknown function [Pseudarcicella hirudinis]
MNDSKILKPKVAHSRLQAIIEEKCPRCRQGKMFEYPFLRVDKFDKMHEFCPVCNLRFEVEPGFWYGAMFISYGFSVGLLIVLGVVIYWFFNDPPIMGYIIPITVISLLAVPFNFRLSRSVFIHLFSFVKYKPQE